MHVVATAGHVDHGKSSLVLALTGTDPDRFEEEKRRGLTIDLGFAHTVLPSGAGVSFVDVPGHVKFLKNMLAGVGAVDACLFIVAATEGWKPQTEEHLRILELVGVRHGVIALTKVDLVDDDHRELVQMDLADHVAGTFLADAEVVPVAATVGLGLDDIRSALDTMLTNTPHARDRERPRLWVDRVFAAKGSGTVVTGTLTSGPLAVGQNVEVGPLRRPARVRAIQTLGQSVESIGPGNRVALNLNGVEHADVARGDAVVTPSMWKPTRLFDASLDVMAALDHDVSRRGAYAVYIGSGEYPAKVRVLGHDAIAPGSSGLVRLHLGTALPLLPGDRFVIRESGRSETVGGGEVLDIAPALPANRAAPDRSADRVVAERGWMTADELWLLTDERREPTLGRFIATADAIAALTAEVHAAVEAAGPLGLDVATLDERGRDVLATFNDVEVVAGRARLAAVVDPLAAHPYVAALAAGGFAPPGADGVDRAELRQLIQRKLIVERDSIYFHPDVIDQAAAVAAQLLANDPEGFTLAALRDATGATRKYIVPLANELDARGITRRRGDLRIAGPRL
jgi:selenocysteine-specific elongation factor